MIMINLNSVGRVVNLEHGSLKEEKGKMVILKQFMYDEGDAIVLRNGIKVGTYCGGVSFTPKHKNCEGKILTIQERVMNEYGNFYITEEYGNDTHITDTMVDQEITKDLHRWQRRNKPLICIIGRTASGKDTFANHIAEDPSKIIKSYTTRPRRDGEGDTHKFIGSVERYKDRWVETEINGYHYFVLEEDVLDNDILIVDPIGFHSLMTQPEFKREVEVYYLMVGPLTRMDRYTSRGNETVGNFIQRNGSEDKQFTTFEKMLENSYFKAINNITVVTSETRHNKPHYRELFWDGNFCGDRMVGGWVADKSKVRPVNDIENANDYIEYRLTQKMRGGVTDE